MKWLQRLLGRKDKEVSPASTAQETGRTAKEVSPATMAQETEPTAKEQILISREQIAQRRADLPAYRTITQPLSEVDAIIKENLSDPDRGYEVKRIENGDQICYILTSMTELDSFIFTHTYTLTLSEKENEGEKETTLLMESSDSSDRADLLFLDYTILARTKHDEWWQARLDLEKLITSRNQKENSQSTGKSGRPSYKTTEWVYREVNVKGRAPRDVRAEWEQRYREEVGDEQFEALANPDDSFYQAIKPKKPKKS